MNNSDMLAIVSVGMNFLKKNYKLVSPREAGFSRLRCLFSQKAVTVQYSTDHIFLGVKALLRLEKIPSMFERMSIPVVIDGTTRNLPLIVLEFQGDPHRLASARCAFDFGLTHEEMKNCSVEDLGTFGIPDKEVGGITNQWLLQNYCKLLDIRHLVYDGSLRGLENFNEVTTTPCTPPVVSRG